MKSAFVQKIISGGQTGADRAALDFAIARGLEHGGFCPKGRRAEDGRIPLCYRLTETESAHYDIRTVANVRDSDATVIFTMNPILEGGSKLTFDVAKKLKKPVLHLHPESLFDVAEELADFLKRHLVRIMNVAGSRASKEPGVGAFVMRVLEKVFV